MTLRSRIFNLFEFSGPNQHAARLLNAALMLLILVNVLAVILESVDVYHQ